MMTVLLDFELHKELKVKAALEGSTVQYLVNEAVRASLDSAPEPLPIRKKTHARALSNGH